LSWFSPIKSFDAAFRLAPSAFALPSTLGGVASEVATLGDSFRARDPFQSTITLSIAAVIPTDISIESLKYWLD
jgi:hypothetical protein